jgi:hypothetical protein
MVAKKTSKNSTLHTKGVSATSAKKLLIKSEVLRHLQTKGMIPDMAAGKCCKPDGGTCCPNRTQAHKVLN